MKNVEIYLNPLKLLLVKWPTWNSSREKKNKKAVDSGENAR